MSEEFDLELGINPKEVFTSKDFLTKGNIKNNDAINMAIIYAVQSADYDSGDILDIFLEKYITLTRSVNGGAVSHYIDGAKARISAEDRKTRIQVDGNQ